MPLEQYVELTASELDSARFGLRIGRLDVTDPLAGRVPPAFLASDLDVLVVRYPASGVRVAAALEGSGVTVLHADTLIYVEGDTSRVMSPDGAHAFEALPGEPPASDLEAAVQYSFGGYVNHYAANPLVDASRVVAGYAEWALAHLGGPDAFVVGIRHHSSSDLAAIAAVSQRGSQVEVDLAGVMPAHRGQGVYQLLLDEVCRRAHARGAPRLLISTQAHNVVAQRAWARRGWLPSSAFQIAHLVRSTDLERVSSASG